MQATNGVTSTIGRIMVKELFPRALQLQEGEVLIRNSFSPCESRHLRLVDHRTRKLASSSPVTEIGKQLDLLGGEEGCGAIVKCGGGVNVSRLGERVAYLRPSSHSTHTGAFASLTIVNALEAFVVPKDISDSVAASTLKDGLVLSLLFQGYLGKTDFAPKWMEKNQSKHLESESLTKFLAFSNLAREHKTLLSDVLCDDITLRLCGGSLLRDDVDIVLNLLLDGASSLGSSQTDEKLLLENAVASVWESVRQKHMSPVISKTLSLGDCGKVQEYLVADAQPLASRSKVLLNCQE